MNPVTIEISDGLVRVIKQCSITHQMFIVEFTSVEFNRIRAGDSPQSVFPTMKPEIREILISGLTPAEWAEALGDEEP